MELFLTPFSTMWNYHWIPEGVCVCVCVCVYMVKFHMVSFTGLYFLLSFSLNLTIFTISFIQIVTMETWKGKWYQSLCTEHVKEELWFRLKIKWN